MARGNFSRDSGSKIIGGKFHNKFLAAIFLGGLQILAGAQTFAEASPSLPSATRAAFAKGPADPTPAWSRFCDARPAECSVDTSEPSTVALTLEVWAAIVKVNVQVNTTIQAVTDADHWGVVDRWDYPDDGKGDCEDIQLLKRKLLVQAGLPKRAMRMTVVVDELGEGHAIMMVRTDHGDFVLDNKHNSVLPWQRTGYAYVKRESSDRTGWILYSGVMDPMVTANR